MRMLCTSSFSLIQHELNSKYSLATSRDLIWPSVSTVVRLLNLSTHSVQAQASLDAISAMVAIEVAKSAANATNLAMVLSTSPQSITAPVSYQLQNLRPFNIPVYVSILILRGT